MDNKKIDVYVEKKDNENGFYYLYYFVYDNERIYLKPYEYKFSKYCTTNLLKEIK